MAQKVVHSVKNCKKFEDEKGNISYRIDDVRLSYPHLWRQDKYERYSATFILDKKTHVDAIKYLLGELKAIAQKDLEQQVPPHLNCLSDGSGSGKPEQEGCFVLTSHTQKGEGRPLVVDLARAPVAEEDGTVYAGCYVNATVRLWAFGGRTKDGKNFPKRLIANLVGVQFLRKGDAFSGAPARPDAEDVFEEFETFEAGSTDDIGGGSDDEFNIN